MAEFDVPTLINAIFAIIAAVSPVVAGYVVSARAKLSAFRKLVDSLDDAWEDGTISDAEYDKVNELAQNLVK